MKLICHSYFRNRNTILSQIPRSLTSREWTIGIGGVEFHFRSGSYNHVSRPRDLKTASLWRRQQASLFVMDVCVYKSASKLQIGVANTKQERTIQFSLVYWLISSGAVHPAFRSFMIFLLLFGCFNPTFIYYLHVFTNKSTWERRALV